MAKLTYIITLGLALYTAAKDAGSEKPRYKDPSVPVEERISDLLSRMTVEEKTAQLIQGMMFIFVYWMPPNETEDS